MTGGQSIEVGAGREVRVVPFRDATDRGVRLAVDSNGSRSVSLSPEQAVELADLLVEAALTRRPAEPAPAMTAAELPLRSIVATKYGCWMKASRGWVAAGVATGFSDADVDVQLARGRDIELSHGATVLRVGDGTTGGAS